MDFDKLKKAAKETLKIMRAKEDPVIEEEDDDFPEIGPEYAESAEPDESAGDEQMGSTQRIDFKNILERFRTKAEDIVPDHEEAKTTPAAESDQIPVTAEAMDELAKTVDEIDKRTEEITIATDENNEKLTASLVTLKAEFDASVDEIKSELAAIRKLIESSDTQTTDSFNSVTAKLNNYEKKADKFTASLAGVSKLNDSIFDLKNSQMNMRNTLSDLEESFYSLKRKMITGVLLISIIAAVVAVLEIINLLS